MLFQESEEPNVARVLGFLRRRGIWIGLCFIFATAAAVALSKHEPKKYTATASVAFNDNPLSQAIAGLPSASSNSTLLQQASNLELLHLGDMAARTAEFLDQGLTAAKVSEAISIAGQVESSVAGVSATSTSPKLAAEIANTYAREFVREQEATNRQYFRSALKLVHKQLSALTPEQRTGTDGLALQDRAQSLGLLAALQPNTVQVAQEASAPTQASSPRTSRNALIGAVLGLFVGVGLALILERLDPRLISGDDFSATYHLPLLGVVPESSALSVIVGDAQPLPSAEAETFHMIRGRLRSLNADQVVTVLITSAAPGDGKTTISWQLARAAARMGSRVLLLELDLRRPRLAQQLGLRQDSGILDVLGGNTSIESAAQAVDSQGALGTLDVLPAGPSVPSNSVELIESRSLRDLLQQAKSLYDLVVIDAPELATVSDTFFLLPKVDGVIVVGRVRQSRRDGAKHLKQALESGGANLVGVIANGAKSGHQMGERGRRDSGESYPQEPSHHGTSRSEPTPSATA